MELKLDVLRTKLKDIDDKEIMFIFKKDEEPLNIRLALRIALTNQYADEQPDGDTKFLRYQLAQKIWNAEKVITITKEEEEELKKLIGKAWGPEVVGFLYKALGFKK